MASFTSRALTLSIAAGLGQAGCHQVATNPPALEIAEASAAGTFAVGSSVELGASAVAGVERLVADLWSTSTPLNADSGWNTEPEYAWQARPCSFREEVPADCFAWFELRTGVARAFEIQVRRGGSMTLCLSDPRRPEVAWCTLTTDTNAGVSRLLMLVDRDRAHVGLIWSLPGGRVLVHDLMVRESSRPSAGATQADGSEPRNRWMGQIGPGWGTVLLWSWNGENTSVMARRILEPPDGLNIPDCPGATKQLPCFGKPLSQWGEPVWRMTIRLD